MKRHVMMTLLGASTALFAGHTAKAAETKTTEAEKKITEDEARSIVSKEVNGKILEVETEKHKGVRVYSVEIKGADGVHEILIDIKTGKIIENKTKNSHDDEDEDGDDD